MLPLGNSNSITPLVIGVLSNESVALITMVTLPSVLFTIPGVNVALRLKTFTGMVEFEALYVSLPGYLTVTLFSPAGKSTGIIAVPFSSVFVLISVPLGNVTIIGALGIVLLVSGSTRVTLIVVLPTVSLVTSDMITESLLTTSTSSSKSLLSV